MFDTTLSRSTLYNKHIVCCMSRDNQINKRKVYLQQKIKKDTVIILNQYAIAKEICDPKKSMDKQDKCRDIWRRMESMLIVLKDMENELKLLDK